MRNPRRMIAVPKTNDDPRCRQPNDCKARGGPLCRGCNFSNLARINAASPEVREKRRAAQKQALQKRFSWLPSELADDYAVLKKKVGAKEAKQMILSQIKRRAA